MSRSHNGQRRNSQESVPCLISHTASKVNNSKSNGSLRRSVRAPPQGSASRALDVTNHWLTLGRYKYNCVTDTTAISCPQAKRYPMSLLTPVTLHSLRSCTDVSPTPQVGDITLVLEWPTFTALFRSSARGSCRWFNGFLSGRA